MIRADRRSRVAADHTKSRLVRRSVRIESGRLELGEPAGLAIVPLEHHAIVPLEHHAIWRRYRRLSSMAGQIPIGRSRHPVVRDRHGPESRITTRDLTSTSSRVDCWADPDWSVSAPSSSRSPRPGPNRRSGSEPRFTTRSGVDNAAVRGATEHEGRVRSQRGCRHGRQGRSVDGCWFARSSPHHVLGDLGALGGISPTRPCVWRPWRPADSSLHVATLVLAWRLSGHRALTRSPFSFSWRSPAGPAARDGLARWRFSVLRATWRLHVQLPARSCEIVQSEQAWRSRIGLHAALERDRAWSRE